MKTIIGWILSKLFPLRSETVYDDQADDCYLDEAEVIMSIARADNETIKKLNSQVG